MPRLSARALAACFLLLLAVVAACSDTGPGASPPAAPRSVAPASPAAPAPFDLGAVIRQVRLAFHPDGDAWTGGTTTYDAAVAEGRLAVTPHVRGAAPVTVETVALGRGAPVPVTRGDGVLAADGHLALARGAAVEHLANTAEGVHQSFRFDALPPGAGDLEVRVHVSGAAYAGVTATGHHFRDAVSGAAIRYGAATWVDGRGRKTALEVRHLGGGDLALVVPEGVLAASAFPAEIDPVIGPQIDVDQPVIGDAYLGQTLPALAFDGTNYLVVWSDDRGIDQTYTEVYGARVTAAGVLLDPGGIKIFTQGPGDKPVAIAFDGTNYLVVLLDSPGNIRATRVTQGGQVLDGGSGKTLVYTNGYMGYVEEVQVAFGANRYLVTWASYSGYPSDVMGMILDTNLTTIVAPFTISNATAGQNHPRVAFGNGNFFVAWDDGRTFGLDIYGARVTPTGTVLDPAGIAITTAQYDQSFPTVATDGTGYFVAWQSVGSSGSGSTIQGARVDMNGTLLDTTPLALSTGSVNDAVPRAAFDGASFVVTYRRLAQSYYDVYANRVSGTGAVLDGTGVAVSALPTSEDHPAIACAPPTCFLVWEDSRSSTDVYGARMQAGAVIDTAGIHVSNAATEQVQPAIAYGGGQYLVVWEEFRQATYGIWGARLDASGNMLDPSGIPISLGTKDRHNPRVASNGNGFLVAWEDLSRSGPGYTYTGIVAARVSAGGVVLDPGGLGLNTNPSLFQDYSDTPTVASDGTNYMVAWHNGECPSTGSCMDVGRVTAAGALLDATPIQLISQSGTESPAITFGAGQYFVVWTGSSGTHGMRVTPSGAVLDAAPGIAIGGGDFPGIGFDGVNYVTVTRDYNGSAYHMVARRVSPAGMALDPSGIVLSSVTFGGYTSAPWRQGAEVAFDGVDSVIVWSAYPTTVYGSWLTPTGVVLSPSTLLTSSLSVIQSPAIAGRGDGDHTLLVTSFGNQSPGVQNYRIEANAVTAKSLGRACATANECKSLDCVDGVCCNTACGGGATNDCQACSVAAGATADGTCSPLTGPACSDNNACTQGDTCQGGTCTPTTTTTCTPLDACHSAGVCQPATGLCTNPAKANGTACDDGNPCTQTDKCQAGVCTGSNPVNCAAPDQCHQPGACDPTSGQCTYANLPDGTTCSDGNPCTTTDGCVNGMCRPGPPLICADPSVCHQPGVCNPTSGQCTYANAPDGVACNDGNACTTVDACQAGACTGTTPVTCAAPDQCHHAGVCDPTSGQCSFAPKADGTTCDDGDACTLSDTCQAGVCAAGTPVTCGKADQCQQAGVCDPTTGQCTYANAADGTACDDGNACTQSDTCQAGVCKGANPVTCTAQDVCHKPGTCNPSTGACNNPKKSNGTDCPGGVCQNGVCMLDGTGGSGGGAGTGGSAPGTGGGGSDAGPGTGGGPSHGSSSGGPTSTHSGCHAAPGETPPGSGLALLPLAGWLLARRRAERRRRDARYSSSMSG